MVGSELVEASVPIIAEEVVVMVDPVALLDRADDDS